MASSDLANYFTVNVECYKCTSAHHGDLEVAWGYSSTRD